MKEKLTVLDSSVVFVYKLMVVKCGKWEMEAKELKCIYFKYCKNKSVLLSVLLLKFVKL